MTLPMPASATAGVLSVTPVIMENVRARAMLLRIHFFFRIFDSSHTDYMNL